MAATLCFMDFRVRVAVAPVARIDRFAGVFRFFADFIFLAALRFVAMILITSCAAR
jgi:hypothetical protein